MFETPAFLTVAAVAVAMALGVVFTGRILHAALFLAGFFLTISALYIMLGSPFLAATQILVYVGGVMIMIIFAVMLTRRDDD
ncbi:MAG: hypothetical protein MSIBF_01650 [Candidatus Altiarchaeales archaeon IMC4]|nr:MAG: hypothetical protein MSIBF_01650 [Candidatus Altiarchaeales archaeon IMC4]